MKPQKKLKDEDLKSQNSLRRAAPKQGGASSPTSPAFEDLAGSICQICPKSRAISNNLEQFQAISTIYQSTAPSCRRSILAGSLKINTSHQHHLSNLPEISGNLEQSRGISSNLDHLSIDRSVLQADHPRRLPLPLKISSAPFALNLLTILSVDFLSFHFYFSNTLLKMTNFSMF
jgi:hypothetical protein